MRPSSRILVALALLTAGLAPRLAAAEQPRRAPAGDSVVLGEFTLRGSHPVVDGDTIRVEGLDASLRLLGLDTEEIYHHPQDRKAAEQDFAAYCKAKRTGAHPAKFGTPMGEAAAAWARRFFDGVSRVRLELDDPGRRRGYYGRYLVYVLVRRDGKWVNYNVEAVRAGMSPYFVKYGRSERFDAQFRAAQAEARAAKRGIWSPTTEHYPDYEERLAWWSRRADEIARFRAKHLKQPALVEAASDDAPQRLLARVGKEVTVFAVIGEARTDKKPYLVPLSHRMRGEIYLVAFDDPQLAKIEPKKWEGEYVYVRGKVSTYRGRPQIKATDLVRIWRE